MNANWSYPTSVKFGPGRIAELPDACRAAGIESPLFVTDRNLKDLPITGRAIELLEGAGFAVGRFADVDANPSDVNLAAGLEAYRAGRHDGVVAFGGGSGLDLGKMIAFMKAQTRPVWDFEDIGDWWTRATPAGIDPIIAVPTTAGTGSEVGRASVITNSETKIKKVIFHPKVLPSVVICDPELTVALPRAITAGTGMDAFAHCLEAFCAPAYHPMSQGIALEGMRLVKENLQRAYEDGSDIEARSNMMSAAAMGAVAFQKGLGAIHALSHPVGAIYDTHHGTTNAVVMNCVLEFNRPAVEDLLASAAAYLGISGGFDGFCAFVDELISDLGIPKSLKELGVPNDRIETLAAMAIEDPTASGNPVPLRHQDAVRLYRKCFELD